MTETMYFVRWKDVEHGPWRLDQVRRLILTTIDSNSGLPNPDYEIRLAASERWVPAADTAELYDLYHKDTIPPLTTMPATPRAKEDKD